MHNRPATPDTVTPTPPLRQFIVCPLVDGLPDVPEVTGYRYDDPTEAAQHAGQATADSGSFTTFVAYELVPVQPDDKAMHDVVYPDGFHSYWSTHCRHGNHEACNATELAPGVPRRPAQCKTCGAPCACTQCDHSAPEVPDVT